MPDRRVQGFDIVIKGKAAATILLAARPTLSALLAAHELREFIKRMTSALLPIAYEPVTAQELQLGNHILIGESWSTRALGIHAERLHGHQEHIVRVVRNKLILLGNDRPVTIEPSDYKYGTENFAYGTQQDERIKDRIFDSDELGSVFAVYSLLENELGVRWYWPGKLGEVVPKRDTIRLPAIERRHIPFMTVCRFNNHAPRQADQPWVNPFRRETMTIAPTATSQRKFESSVWRLRNKSSRGVLADGHSKLLRSFLKRFEITRPDFWGTNIPKSEHQLCLTNQDVIDQVVTDIVNVFRQDDKREDNVGNTLSDWDRGFWDREIASGQVSLWPEDSDLFCKCETCESQYRDKDPAIETAGDASEFSNQRRSYYVWNFVSAVAERVAAALPQVPIKIVCGAYWKFFYPPENVQIPANVIVAVAVHFHNHNRDDVKEYESRALAGWSALLREGQISLYAYYLYPRFGTVALAPLVGPEEGKKELVILERDLIAKETWELSFSSPRMLANSLKYAIDQGARAFTAELCPWPITSGCHDNVIFDHLNMYVTMKVSERPDIDIDALLSEYYRLFYGPAQAAMREFWEGLEELWMSPCRHWNWWTEQQVEQLGRHIECALLAAASHPERDYQNRIEMVNDAVFNMLNDSNSIRTRPLISDFQATPLHDFIDIFGNIPPRPDFARIEAEWTEIPGSDGMGRTNYFIKVPGVGTSIMRIIPKPIVVNDCTSIEIKVRMRCTAREYCAVFLSALRKPDGWCYDWVDHPETATEFGIGTGFGIKGNNELGSIGCCSNQKPEFYEARSPLLKSEAWHAVRIRYVRISDKEGLITAWVDDSPYHEVSKNLAGAVFNGIWLPSSLNGACYDDLSVTVQGRSMAVPSNLHLNECERRRPRAGQYDD